jgi:putative peptidoglycan lipid II flippase
LSPAPDQPQTAGDEPRKLLRGASIFGALTAASRALGLLRDMALTAVLSQTARDAFLLAFSIPNMFRNLFGEGALTNSLVPVYVERIEKSDREGANRLASLVFTALAVGLGLIALVGGLACLGMSLNHPPGPLDKNSLALRLLAIMAPFLPLVCLYAFFMALLTSHRRFAVPGFAPVLLNVAILAGAYLAWKRYGLASTTYEARAAYIIAVAVLVGGTLQLLVELPSAWSAGVRIRPGLGFRDEAFRSVAAAMAPVLIGTGVYQLNTFLNRIFAWTMAPEPAAQSYLALANLLVMAPMGIIAVALATAALPALSSLHARGDKKGFGTTLAGAMRMSLFMLIPVSTVLIVSAEPIINLLYGRGGWQSGETPHMVRVLFWSALALPPTVVTMLAARAFYAMKLPKIPARIAVTSVIINVVLSVLLVRALFTATEAAPGGIFESWLRDTRLAARLGGPREASLWLSGAAGLALASTLSATLQMILTLSALKRQRPELKLGGVAVTALRAAAMCVPTGLFVYWVTKSLPPTGEGFIIVAQRGIAPVLAGIFAYTLVASLLDTAEYREAWRALRGRKKKDNGKDKKNSRDGGGDEDDEDEDDEDEDEDDGREKDK